MLIGLQSRTFDLSKIADRDCVNLCPPHLKPADFAGMSEGQRLAEIRASATVPADCGPDIPVAPARGAFQTFRPIEIVPGTAGTARNAGYQGRGEDRPRKAIRSADVFDEMIEAARKAHDKRGQDAGRFVPPFTPGQVQMARDYRDLVEQRNAGGVKCAQLQAGRGGSGGGSFMDAYLAAGLRLAAIHRRIGDGAALAIRRIRPSTRGKAQRGIITDRVLVTMVCLSGKTISQVLKAHGWTLKGETREAARKALAAALDRMQGYRDSGDTK